VLAESWWNDDPLRWTLRLRKNVPTHDGSFLTSADVVDSLKHAKEAPSTLAGHFSDVVDVVDRRDGTVTIVTRRPVGTILDSLTGVVIFKRSGGPVPIVGTGPYRVTSLEPGQRVVLARFEKHRDPAPHLDGAVFSRFTTPDEAVALFAGDAASIMVDAPREVIAKADGDPRFVVEAVPTGSLQYLAFRFTDRPLADSTAPNPLRDKRVRRAALLALDRAALAREETLGRVPPATQLIPPGVAGFDVSLPSVGRDVAGAKALLQEAGLASGFDVVLDASYFARRLAESVASQLHDVGIRATVKTYASDEFRKRIEGESDFYLYNWVVGEDSGEALKTFFHTKDLAHSLGLRNRIGYSNAAVDAALEEAAATTEPVIRIGRIQAAMRLLMDDLPWVPLFGGRSLFVSPRGLVVPERTDGMLRLAEVKPREASKR